MDGHPTRIVVALGLFVVAASAFAVPVVADGAPTPAGTLGPPPTGIELASTVTVLNPDGSFMAAELRTMTNTITFDEVVGFSGVYEVQRSREMRHSSATKDFKQLNVVFPASASQGKLRQVDTVGFIEALTYEFCYRVRTVISGENGPFSPEVCTIAPPSSGPVPAARTSVPGHPLQVVFGPQPAGTISSAWPDVSAALAVDGLAALRRLAPGSLPAALKGYWLSGASGRVGSGVFSAQANFRGEGDRLLIIRSWTKTGDFVTGVPANSPVTEATQTYIEGLAALTLLPTIAVVGGIGPREIWMTDGSTIWHLDLMNYSDNEEALALAAEVARAVQSPSAPGTGAGYRANADGGPPLRAPLLGAGFALAGAAVVVVSRLVSRQR